MTRLLVIEASPRGDRSISRQMTRRFVQAWRSAHPGAEVSERVLLDSGLAFVTAPWLDAYFTPPARHTARMRETLALSDQLVAELLAADQLLIATPVYNYNVPAVLKAWIDHIVRKGITLGVDGRGLLAGKKATVLIASGGVYTEGSPMRERDIASDYLRLILAVIGIDDVTVVAGGGAKAVDLGEQSMDGFLAGLAPALERAAAN
jgi:FMN-dependent NADH-azoreductase